MGGLKSTVSGFYQNIVPYPPPRSLMTGLDSSGKTTILFKLKLGEVVQTIPTIGFNVESIHHKKLELTVWDVGGQVGRRALWRHYYAKTQVIIFVIDSHDRDRIDESKKELHEMLCDKQLQDIILLIYGNKQDLPNAMNRDEITGRLQLDAIEQNIQWRVQPTSAIGGDGLIEGLDWVYKQLKKKKKIKSKRKKRIQ